MSVTPALLRVKDAGSRLAISDWEVRRLAKAGILHLRYVGEKGRYYRITAESVDAYIASLTSEKPA